MLAVLTAHLWQSTWFALAAALFTLAFRGHRAQVRYALWLAASIKFLVPPAHQRRGVLTLAGPVALGLLTAAHPPALGAQSATPSRRHLAMFFDFSGMNSGEQARAREAAIGFVQTKLQPADVVSVMTAVNGKLTIRPGFHQRSSCAGVRDPQSHCRHREQRPSRPYRFRGAHPGAAAR